MLWIVVALVLPVTSLEWWIANDLFNHVLYSNSVSLDATINAWNARDDWQMVYLGDSEIRWGFDPAVVDAELAKADIHTAGFNFGIDGFSSGLYQAALPYLPLHESEQIKAAVIGIQMVEVHSSTTIESYRQKGEQGALQRPIFASVFARDRHLDQFLREPEWTDPIVCSVESISQIVRCRSALRHYLLGPFANTETITFQSTGLSYHTNGFQPHQPISESRENYQQDYVRIMADAASGSPAYAPLPENTWEAALQEDAFFDRYSDYFLARGILPVFVALPTNPFLIDLKNRREDYHRNSAALKQWADQRGVVFIDLGIQDDLEHDLHYSDYRHLSGEGAALFSKKLGVAIAANPQIRQKLTR